MYTEYTHYFQKRFDFYGNFLHNSRDCHWNNWHFRKTIILFTMYYRYLYFCEFLLFWTTTYIIYYIYCIFYHISNRNFWSEYSSIRKNRISNELQSILYRYSYKYLTIMVGYRFLYIEIIRKSEKHKNVRKKLKK